MRNTELMQKIQDQMNTKSIKSNKREKNERSPPIKKVLKFLFYKECHAGTLDKYSTLMLF